MKEEMKRLLAEKERQDRELARIEEHVRSLANHTGIVVPAGFFEEVDAVCATALAGAADVSPPAPALGLRA